MSKSSINWQYQYDTNPELYFLHEERISSSYVWKFFVLYMKDKIENFEIYAPKLKKIFIDFAQEKINGDQYIYYKFLCESSQIKNINVKFTNFELHKKKDHVRIIFSQYMVQDKTVPCQILVNLPTNTHQISFVFTHINLPSFCWIHNKINCKISPALCYKTKNTMIFDSNSFANLPLSITEIIINTCIKANNVGIIIDKCKLPVNVNLILNLKSEDKLGITIDQIIFPDGVSNFIINSKENVVFSDKLLTYLKEKTVVVINNFLQ